MIPAYNKWGVLLSIRDGNPLQAKIRLPFPEGDTAMPYSRFELKPTWLQAKRHIHHTGWATLLLLFDSNKYEFYQ
ncbi:hypothetical protein TNCV_2577281 [Trichonephila clavipes]|nr:hypothetical protein TNCV_2577281 [Trichonephila clavipes]